MSKVQYLLIGQTILNRKKMGATRLRKNLAQVPQKNNDN